MKRTDHLMELIESIKRTEAMISLHQNDELQLMRNQYEIVKAKQIAEFIDSLAKPPFQSVDSFSLIKMVINKYYPTLDSGNVERKDLKELVMAL